MLRAGAIFVLVAFLGLPHSAYAILPPDIIFNTGYQFAQFFSFIALAVGGLGGSIIVFLRPQVLFIQKNIYTIIGTVVFGVTVAIGAIYLLQAAENNRSHLEQIKILTEQLEAATRALTTESRTLPAVATSTDAATDWDAITDARKLFINNTIFLYGDDEGTPFYLEIDLNRRQAPNGTFMHYYYIVGVHGDVEISEYATTYSTSTVPVPLKSIQYLERALFSDLSTREEYRGAILFNGEPLTFAISNLQGDFITRNSASYTRYQSVGVGMVTVGDRNIPVRALVEGIHSSDFSKQIFFEGNDKVEATTRQFVLWDEEDNFYMIDQSHVTSHTPEYPSHTWLLYKNATDGYTKKGFTSDVVAQSFMGRPETGWTITAPEFYDATIKLSVVKYINDGDYQTRMRPIVQGTITDNDGTRTIRGFGFIIR